MIPPDHTGERLKAAEAVCIMYGWSAAVGPNATDRELATLQLWNRWYDLVGPEFAGPKQHRDLSDSEKELADERRAHDAAVREKIDRLVKTI